MKAVALIEPVYYIVHDGIKINAEYFKHFLDGMRGYESTIFDKNDPEEAAMLNIVYIEKKEIEKNRPEGFIGYEHDLGDAIQIEWCGDNEEFIDVLVGKIDDAIKEARKC